MDLEQIARSGQCFRMNKTEDGSYAIKAFGTELRILQDGSEFTFSCSEEEFESIWHNYFDLSTDYNKIKQSIDADDSYLLAAAEYGSGVRILNQDLWEMIITFMISQNNNIPRIKKSIEVMCDTLADGAFPSAEQIASGGIEKLSEMGLGYRDKYIIKMAQNTVNGEFDVEGLRHMDYKNAHRTLMSQYGIGKKVADCVCLFGLHHVDAFPVDVHIKKILEEHYPQGFPYERYKGYLGIMQQYMFYYDLKN